MSFIKSDPPDTPISLFLIGITVCSLFAAYQVFQPQLQQIDINKTQINVNNNAIRGMSEAHVEYNKHILNISNSLSRIEGRLEIKESIGPQRK